MKTFVHKGLFLSPFISSLVFFSVFPIFDSMPGLQQAQAAPAVESFTFSGSVLGTSINGNRPAGTVAGDLLIAIMTTDGGGGLLTAPTGWTAITNNIGSGHTSRSWYKIAGTSEPASYTFTVNSWASMTIGILRISGHAPANPINVSGTNTGTSMSPTAPSVTTTVNDALILRYYGADDDDYTGDDTGYPPAHTGIYRRQSGNFLWFSNECHQSAAHTTQLSAGTTGTAAFSQNQNEEWSAVTIAIAPAPPSPNILLLKTVQAFSDPVNGTTNPKAIPGAVMRYTILPTNQGIGEVDTDTVVISDPIPLNTEMYVGDDSSSPVTFIDGATSSGLTFTFTSLSSTTDDINFSNDGGSTFTYSPSPIGYDSNVTHIRINPKGPFHGASGGNTPSFQIRFQVRVE